MGGVKRSNLAPKLDFLKDCFRTASQNFSIFCMKLDNNKAFQTMHMLSSGKLLPRPSRGQKVKLWAQNWLFQKLSCLNDWWVVAVGPVVQCPLFHHILIKYLVLSFWHFLLVTNLQGFAVIFYADCSLFHYNYLTRTFFQMDMICFHK